MRNASFTQDFGQNANQSLMRMALELPAPAGPAGTPVALAVVKARAMVSRTELVPAEIAVGQLALK